MLDALKKDRIRSGKQMKLTLTLTIYRLGNFIYYSNINLLYKKIVLIILKKINLFFIEIPFGIDIPFEARIDKGLRLIHLNGIVIHPNVIIGKKLYYISRGYYRCK